jgi:uncharacterized protein
VRAVKRLEITIPVIRRLVRDRLRPEPLPPLEEDPLWKFVGGDPDTEPVEDIDEFLYGPSRDVCDHDGVMTEAATGRLPTLVELRARRDEILEIASHHGVFNVRVFGSVARGDATHSSDIDLLVDVEDGRSLFDLGAFYMDLRDLLGYEVDVGTEIKPRLRVAVDAEPSRCEPRQGCAAEGRASRGGVAGDHRYA